MRSLAWDTSVTHSEMNCKDRNLVKFEDLVVVVPLSRNSMNW